MRWSVSVVAEGDREMTREEIVELADAVAGARRDRLRHRDQPSYGAQLVVEADEQRRGGRARRRPSSSRPRRGPACRPGRSPALEARRARTTRSRRGRVIRLGSLAGYPFEGPRVLAGWTPPARPAVFAIVVQAGSGDQARTRTR